MTRTRTAARKRAWIMWVAAAASIVAAASFAFLSSSEDTRTASLALTQTTSTQSSLEASVAHATALSQQTDDADTGEPVSTGASTDGASMDHAAPAGGASPAGGVPPTDGESPSAEDVGSVPPGSVSRLDAAIAVPQTYRCVVRVSGWQNPDGYVAMHVDSAELLGPIDPKTGEPTGEPASDAPDFSEQLRSLDVLASAPSGVRPQLRLGETVTVYLVLLPSGDGSTMYLDRVK